MLVDYNCLIPTVPGEGKRSSQPHLHLLRVPNRATFGAVEALVCTGHRVLPSRRNPQTCLVFGLLYKTLVISGYYSNRYDSSNASFSYEGNQYECSGEQMIKTLSQTGPLRARLGPGKGRSRGPPWPCRLKLSEIIYAISLLQCIVLKHAG